MEIFPVLDFSNTTMRLFSIAFVSAQVLVDIKKPRVQFKGIFCSEGAFLDLIEEGATTVLEGLFGKRRRLGFFKTIGKKITAAGKKVERVGEKTEEDVEETCKYGTKKIKEEGQDLGDGIKDHANHIGETWEDCAKDIKEGGNMIKKGQVGGGLSKIFKYSVKMAVVVTPLFYSISD